MQVIVSYPFMSRSAAPLAEAASHEFECEKILRHYTSIKSALLTSLPSSALGSLNSPDSVHSLREEELASILSSGRSTGGSKLALQKALKHKIDVDVKSALWTSALFAFFGIFGATDPLSKFVLISAAPLSIAVKVRAVKVWLYKIFYQIGALPGVIASLLPGTVRCVMEFDEERSMRGVYGEGVIEAEYGGEGGHEEEEEEEEEEDVEETEEDGENDGEAEQEAEQDDDEDDDDDDDDDDDEEEGFI